MERAGASASERRSAEDVSEHVRQDGSKMAAEQPKRAQRSPREPREFQESPESTRRAHRELARVNVSTTAATVTATTSATWLLCAFRSTA